MPEEKKSCFEKTGEGNESRCTEMADCPEVKEGSRTLKHTAFSRKGSNGK